MTTENQVSVETLDQIMQAFNSHDVEKIIAFFADDCEFDTSVGASPWGDRLTGKAAIHADLTQRFAQVPDAHYAVERQRVQGALAVTEWTLTGTAPNGQNLNMRGCDLWEFRDQKITRKDAYRKSVVTG